MSDEPTRPPVVRIDPDAPVYTEADWVELTAERDEARARVAGLERMHTQRTRYRQDEIDRLDAAEAVIEAARLASTTSEWPKGGVDLMHREALDDALSAYDDALRSRT